MQLVEIRLQGVMADRRERPQSPLPGSEINLDALYSFPPSSTESLVPGSDVVVKKARSSVEMETSDYSSPMEEEDAKLTGENEVPELAVPSALLCTRCPICFGGAKPDLRQSW